MTEDWDKGDRRHKVSYIFYPCYLMYFNTSWLITLTSNSLALLIILLANSVTKSLNFLNV